jgi:hypothetical protein
MPVGYRQFTPDECVEHQSGLFVTPTETAQPDATTNTATITKPSLSMPVDAVAPRLVQIERMLLERVERHQLEHAFVGRLKDYPRRHTGFPRLDPAQHMQTPAIPRIQAPKSHVGARGTQVVAMLARKFEELCRHFDAYKMRHAVLPASAAAPVAKESGQRIEAAGVQRPAEHVFFFGRLIAHMRAFYWFQTGSGRTYHLQIIS